MTDENPKLNRNCNTTCSAHHQILLTHDVVNCRHSLRFDLGSSRISQNRRVQPWNINVLGAPLCKEHARKHTRFIAVYNANDEGIRPNP